MTNIKGEIVLPPIKTFAIEENAKDQALKVLEEAAEVVEAVKNPDKDLSEKVEEVMDTIQACCNLLEKLEVTDLEIRISYQDVVDKNTKRGRYDER